MTSHRKKILLAVDGSNQSLEAVRYVSSLFPPERIRVVLFHVMSKIPEVFYDLGREAGYVQGRSDFKGWEIGSEESINKFMTEARQILIDAGIGEKEITIDIRRRKIGIARDIIVESIHGYDAVVVGRTGVIKFRDFVTGSIANKLLERLGHVSVCVVGGKAKPAKILLGLDESDGAMRAVDFVGAMLGDSAAQITLLHVVRSFDIFEHRYEDTFDPSYEKEWIETYEIDSLFEEAKMHLVKSGIDARRITTKLVQGVSSRAGAILQEARHEGFGTIVVGRRGLSEVKEFCMGRVSSKVIQLARDHAVWIVS
jgi:nucleotide-binding universal stress UspA family protein